MPNKKSALILLFSPREKKRNILSAGLIHAGYRVIEAQTAYIAGVKANQYVPDLAIADISKDNIRDFLFLTRLESGTRTKNIKVLLSVTSEVKNALEQIRKEVGSPEGSEGESRIHMIQYPYKFNDLAFKIKDIFKQQEMDREQNTDELRSKHIISGKLLGNDLTVSQKLELISQQVDKQWSFPFTVIKSLQIIGDENSCCRELAKCIESDVAATSSILNMSNKLNFAGRYKRIDKVLDAVVRMGFNETKNILAMLTLIDISSHIHLKHGFSRSEFWMHSLATGIIADILCKHINYERKELGFITGLIHDVGKIPMDNHFTNIFSTLLEDTTTRITSFEQVEHENMGLTHSDIGHYFTHAWDFPPLVTKAILNHHDINKILSSQSIMERRLQEIVFVSNIFAKALSFGHSCDEVLTEIPNKILVDLKIQSGLGPNIVDKVYVALKQYYEYLKVASGDVILREPQRNTKQMEINIILGSEITFHPIIMSLQYSGYNLNITKEVPEDNIKSGISIFIPDRDHPLDIILDDEDIESESMPQSESSSLKIFLLEMIDTATNKKDVIKGDFVLMDRKNIDMRFLLHIIEDYYYENSMKISGL